MVDKIVKSESEWQSELDPETFRVARLKGTEAPFTGELNDEKRDGVFRCACCGQELFASGAKFESGSGWPSFVAPVTDGHVDEHRDASHGMVRTEVICSRCDAHLGHVFDDGPRPAGLRYCINSAALAFEPDKGEAK